MMGHNPHRSRKPVLESLEARLLLSGSIDGQVWDDLNGDGLRDAGEVGLNGVTVELVDRTTDLVVTTQATADVDLDGSGTIDPATESGRYAFAGIAAGDYEVRQALPAGWQTAPTFDGPGNLLETNVSDTALAVNGNGEMAVVYTKGGRVYANRYQVDGSAIGDPIDVAEDYRTHQHGIAIDGAGNFTVVWYHETTLGDDDGRVMARMFWADGTARTGAFVVNQYSDRYQTEPSIAMADDGRFVVTWENDPLDSIYARRFAADGTALADEFMVNTTTDDNQQTAHVAMNDSGAFVVVWQHNTGSWPGIAMSVYGQAYDAAGVAVGTEFRVDATGSASFMYPKVAMDAAGGFVVAFNRRGDSETYSEVLARQYPAGGPAGDLFDVSGLTGDSQYHPNVMIDDTGGFTIVWARYTDESRYDILGQQYDAAGDSMGAKFEWLDETGAGGLRWSTNIGVPDPAGRLVGLSQNGGDLHARWQSETPSNNYWFTVIDNDIAGAHFGVVQPAVVAGQVFEDLNGNGVRDAGETGLDGWTIELLDADTHDVLSTAVSASVDVDGSGAIDPETETGLYSFAGLFPGDYLVRQTPQAGYLQVAPEPIVVTYEATETLTSVNETVTFEFDVDVQSLPLAVDGAVLDVITEDDIKGVPTYLQVFGEGMALGNVFEQYEWDNSDPAHEQLPVTYAQLMTMAADGVLSFELSPMGPLNHLEFLTVSVTFSGVVDPAYHELTLTSDSAVDADFALIQSDSSLAGQVFEDIDASGAREAGEARLNGWHVDLVDTATGLVVARATTSDLDLDGSGAIDPETETGRYVFADVLPGDYEVRQVGQSTHLQTLPAAAYALTVGVDDPHAGLDFGNQLIPITIQGSVFRDIDKNGRQDFGEVGDDGRTVELIDTATGAVIATAVTASVDLDGNGSINPVTESGRYRFVDLAPGRYTVRGYLPAGTWGWTGPLDGPQILGDIFQIGEFGEGLGNRPQAAMDADGNTFVTWMSQNVSDTFDVWGRAYLPDGTPRGPAFPVDVDANMDARRPMIATTSAGDVVITWTAENETTSHWDAYVRRFSIDGTAITGAIPVNTATEAMYFSSDVAVDVSGNFVVVWADLSELDGDRHGVFARLFDVNGAPLTGEFLVNETTDDNQHSPAVAMAPDGRFVVAWQSPRPGSTVDDIAVARIYDANGQALTGEFRALPATDVDDIHAVADTAGTFLIVADGRPHSIPDGWEGQRYDWTGQAVGDPLDLFSEVGDVQMVADGTVVHAVEQWDSHQYPFMRMQIISPLGRTLTDRNVSGSWYPGQTGAGVAANDNNQMVQVWRRGNPGDDSRGIFGRFMVGGLVGGEYIFDATWGDSFDGALGYAQPNGLSGQVFDDTNANGLLNPSEVGLSGWELELVDPGTGLVLDQTLTGDVDLDGDGVIDPTTESGLYTFDTAETGDLLVRLVLAPGWLATAPAPPEIAVNLGFAQQLVDLDFAAVEQATVSGLVFYDVNGNGLQDPTETPLAGQTVRVVDTGDGSTAAEALSTGAGFEILGLLPGDYELQLVPATDWAQSFPVDGSGYPMTLTEGLVVTGQMFGAERAAGSIGGRVFHDWNHNGAFDAGDIGLFGSTVELVDTATGLVVATTVSGDLDLNSDGVIDPVTERGWYELPGLIQGDYEVRQVLRPGWTETLPAAGSYVLNLPADVVIGGLGFGSYGTPAVGDVNGDGTVDAHDIDELYANFGAGVPDRYDLDGDGDADTDDMDILIWDVLGTNYGDVNLDGVTDLTDLMIMKSNFGSSGAGWAGGDLNGDGVVNLTDLMRMRQAYRDGRIEGVIWNDADGDRSHDPDEVGLDGQVVELLDAVTGLVIQQVTTYSNDRNHDGAIDPFTESGLYHFRDLVAGRYEVRAAPLAGWTQSVAAMDPSIIGPDQMPDITFQETNYLEQTWDYFNFPAVWDGHDFIEYHEADLRPTMWKMSSEYHASPWLAERGGSSIYTATEFLLAYTPGADPHTYWVLFEDERSVDGWVSWEYGVNFYDFDVKFTESYATSKLLIHAEDYSGATHGVTGPDGVTIWVPEGGNLDLTFDLNRAFELATQQRVTGMDFGLTQSMALSGQVVDDSDGDGTIDPTEAGLDGWTVELTNGSGTVLASTTTASVDLDGSGAIDPATESGLYEFATIASGDLAVQLSPPAGWVQTSPAGPHAVTFVGGQVHDDLDFTMVDPVDITGQVFDDADADGAKGLAEAGLDAWTVQLLDAATGAVLASTTTVQLDLDGSGAIDPATEAGLYSFGDLMPGDYRVRQVDQLGRYQTTPAGDHVLTLTSGADVTDLRFGLAQATQFGRVFDDLDRDGREDTTETGIDGVTVELWDLGSGLLVDTQLTASGDLDGNGSVDSITETGRYAFGAVPAGVYEVRIVVGDGWVATTPTTVERTSAGGELDPINFALAEELITAISEVVVDDQDGVFGYMIADIFYPSSSAWGVNIAAGGYQEDFFTNGSGFAAAQFSVALPDTGSYQLSMWWPTPVDLPLPLGTLKVTVTDATGDQVFFVSQGGGLGGDPAVDPWYEFPASFDFASGSASIMVEADGADPNTVILDAIRLAPTPADGSIHGRLFEDLDADGLIGPTEVGLDGWAVQLVNVTTGHVLATQWTQSADLNGDGSIDPLTETGLYDFLRLPADDYEVRANLEAGWDWTVPADGIQQRTVSPAVPDHTNVDIGAMLAGGGLDGGALGDPIDLLAELETVV